MKFFRFNFSKPATFLSATKKCRKLWLGSSFESSFILISYHVLLSHAVVCLESNDDIKKNITVKNLLIGSQKIFFSIFFLFFVFLLEATFNLVLIFWFLLVICYVAKGAIIKNLINVYGITFTVIKAALWNLVILFSV